MSRKCYFGDYSTIAHSAKKIYFGDSNGVARKVKKAYIGDENNIARLVFVSGVPVVWNKYLASRYTIYTRIGDGVGGTGLAGDGCTASKADTKYEEIYDDYSWGGVTEGYVGTSPAKYYYSELTEELVNNQMVGKYMVTSFNSDQRVFLITGLNTLSVSDTGYITLRLNIEIVARAVSSYSYIPVDGIFEGPVESIEGELPEEGYILDGSVDGDYCVLSSKCSVSPNHLFHYYIRQNSSPAVL